MMAVVFPGRAVKVMSSRAYSSAPGYRKLTWSNATVPVHAVTSSGISCSRITGSVRRISSIRSADTTARGSMMDTMVIIMKDMTICIV